jgi:hypothetical protein
LLWPCLRKLAVIGMAVAAVVTAFSTLAVMAMCKVMVMDMAATTVVQATIGWPLCWVLQLWAA